MVGWVGVCVGGGGGRGWLMDIVPPAFSWKCLKCLISIALRLECGYFDLICFCYRYQRQKHRK